MLAQDLAASPAALRRAVGASVGPVGAGGAGARQGALLLQLLKVGLGVVLVYGFLFVAVLAAAAGAAGGDLHAVFVHGADVEEVRVVFEHALAVLADIPGALRRLFFLQAVGVYLAAVVAGDFEGLGLVALPLHAADHLPAGAAYVAVLVRRALVGQVPAGIVGAGGQQAG